MSAHRHALVLAIAFLALFVGANLIVSTVLRGARIDLTESRVYSLSPGARTILADVVEPIQLTFYYSREAAAPYPQVRAYAARVRELLQTFATRSGGKVRIVEIEPERFAESEDAAMAAGLQPLNPGGGGDPIYLGLVGANAVDERVVIPAFSWEREAFLEYELTRVVAELEQPQRLNVALISALPLNPALAADPQMASQSGQPAWLQDLVRAADVEMLDPSFATIPPTASLLAIIHPWALSESQLRAVDQFVLSKGRAFIAVDPAALTASAGQAPSPFAPPPQTGSELDRLLKAWGVAVSKDVVMDAERGLALQPNAAPQPLFFAAPPEQLAKDELMTAGLSRGLVVLAPGAISWAPTSGVIVTPLVQSSAATMRMDAARAALFPPPEETLATFVSANKRETLAVRISGTLATAAPGAGIARSTAPAEIVLVADVDLFDDRLYLDPRQGALRDNGAFLLNALDRLGGSDALVSLRARAPAARSLTLVDDLRARGERQAASTQAALEREVAATEERLAALQAKGANGGFFTGDLGAELSAAERDEVERFQTRLLQLRSQVRASERAVRADLDRLEGWTQLANIWLAPVLVVLGGLFFLWRRRRPSGAGADAATPASVGDAS